MTHVINVIEDEAGRRFFQFEGLTIDTLLVEWFEEATRIFVLNQTGSKDMELKIRFSGTHDPLPFFDGSDSQEGIPAIICMMPYFQAVQLKKGGALSVEFEEHDCTAAGMFASTLCDRMFIGWANHVATGRIPDKEAFNQMPPRAQDALYRPIFEAVIAEAKANPSAPLRF